MAEIFSIGESSWYNFGLIIYPLFICGGILAGIQCDFFLKFTKIKAKIWHWFLYVLLFYVVHCIGLQVQLSSSVLKLLEFCCAYGFSFFALRCPSALALIMAGFVVMVNQLTEGILVPLSKIWMDWFVTSPDSPAFVLSVIFLPVLTVVIAYYTYRYILLKYQIEIVQPQPYLAILFAPLLLIILSIGLIIDTGYSTTTIDKNTGKLIPLFNDYQVLCISIAAIICMGVVLFAFKKFMDHLAAEKQQILLGQQLAMQKEYLSEAQSRYALTRSFRHDIRNHLLVLNGLLEEGEMLKAQDYLKKLEEISGSLSFIAHTGNVAVDALLNNKLSLAKQSGIRIDCDVKIPADVHIDDFDLCVILANALDNAIRACAVVAIEQKYIRLISRRKGDFFMIEVENSSNDMVETPKGSGMGIPNMRAAAEKYCGVVRIESACDRFTLTVLLIISLH